MGRGWLVPEVVQTSAMDCGPAALKAILEGHGIHISFGRLREACQTDIDGTSIDVIEEVANQLDLDAEQTIVPWSNLLRPEAAMLPALVIGLLPSRARHFAVIWNVVGSYAQVMDPSIGRRWVHVDDLYREVYFHRHELPADVAAQWATQDDFVRPLRARLHALTKSHALGLEVDQLVLAEDFRGVLAYDATCRHVESLVRVDALRCGAEAMALFRAALAQPDSIPESSWAAVPADDDDYALRGVITLRVRGRHKGTIDTAALGPELTGALNEPPPRPLRQLFGFLRDQGGLTWTVLALGLVCAVLGAMVEAVVIRGLLGSHLALHAQADRLRFAVALGALLSLSMLLEVPTAFGLQRLGRQLEIRFRAAFLERLPRLHDRYLQSRLVGDMAERSHAVHGLRGVPDLGGRVVRVLLEALVTIAALVWLDPQGAWLTIAGGLATLAVPFVMQPAVTERDLRARTHVGALARFQLDAFLGLTAIRAHRAETVVRREHESLLVHWSRAALEVVSLGVVADVVQTAIGTLVAVGLLWHYVSAQHDGPATLLLLYWALNLPALGQEVGDLLAQLPRHKNVALRLLEPLGAPTAAIASPEVAPAFPRAVNIALAGVDVVAGGNPILSKVDLAIPAGSHVAVVGASGAGKSTLLGLLLGWHRASTGTVFVDGHPLSPIALDALRERTAWVDPAIHLWNRSLLENVEYGADGDALDPDHIARVLEQADLRPLLERLPDGLQSKLGESGCLVSGGEGQRVRFGRSLLREKPSLVLLDEPFRGLDRGQRQSLLSRARELWRDATMLCVTHDLRETVSFDRVLVVDEGRIVEDGRPEVLLDDPASRYRALYDAEVTLHNELRARGQWRRVRIEAGALTEHLEEA